MPFYGFSFSMMGCLIVRYVLLHMLRRKCKMMELLLAIKVADEPLQDFELKAISVDIRTPVEQK